MDLINGIDTELYMFILENDSVEKATFIDNVVRVINNIDDLPGTPIKMDLSYFNVIPQTISDTIQNNIGTELSNGEIVNIMLSTYMSSVIEILKSTGIYINSEVENSLLLDILDSIYHLLDIEYELKDKYALTEYSEFDRVKHELFANEDCSNNLELVHLVNLIEKDFIKPYSEIKDPILKEKADKQIEEVIQFLQNKAQTINKYSLANNTTESLLAYNEQFIKQIKIHY